MSAQRFSTGKRFYLDGTLYEVKRLILPDQKVNVEDLATGALLILEMRTLVTALFRGDLCFEVEGSQARRKKLEQPLDLSDYPPYLVEVARHRLEVIQPLLKLEPEERTEATVIARVEEVKAAQEKNGATAYKTAISRPSVYRWINDYLESGEDLRVLIPDLSTRGGAGKPRLDAEANAILVSVIKDNYLRREKVTIDDIVHLTAARIEEENELRAAGEKLIMPSRPTVARRIDALDMREKYEAKHGKRAAKRQLSQVGRMERAEHAMERVEADDTKIDQIVIDEEDNLPLGRPTLTYCLDNATTYPLGYYLGFEPASYYTVMECLYHSICQKENIKEIYGTEHDWIAYGTPFELVVDNGSHYTSSHLADSCELLGVILTRCPVQTPEFKAGIERHFGTLNSGLFHKFPGTTFSNIFQRGDYDSVKQACISLNELERALNIFIVDIYAENFHKGLNGIPARRWENLTANFSPRLPSSRDELLILLGRVTWRTIRRAGVELETLRYNCSDLAALRSALKKGEKAKVKYHPGDLSRVYVFNPFDEEYIEVPALDQQYTAGLSLWKHRVIHNFAEQEEDEVDLAALGRAKRKIQEIVDTARTRKRMSTRSKTARWESKPPSMTRTDKPAVPPSNAPTLPAVAAPLPALPGGDDVLEVEQPAEGWEIAYSLPKSRRETVEANTEVK